MKVDMRQFSPPKTYQSQEKISFLVVILSIEYQLIDFYGL
ncbi:hypothetical protein HMPREF1564_2976 [Providencia alcalifaciens R90-1475]|nr:hypothetical protein HMPREF1564_2976 [Providencia alcalifaciens R90-1475]